MDFIRQKDLRLAYFRHVMSLLFFTSACEEQREDRQRWFDTIMTTTGRALAKDQSSYRMFIHHSVTGA